MIRQIRQTFPLYSRQMSTSLYCMGEETEDVLTSTNIPDNEKESYKAVLAANFNNYFKVHKYVIFERAVFNCRNQLKGNQQDNA